MKWLRSISYEKMKKIETISDFLKNGWPLFFTIEIPTKNTPKGSRLIIKQITEMMNLWIQNQTLKVDRPHCKLHVQLSLPQSKFPHYILLSLYILLFFKRWIWDIFWNKRKFWNILWSDSPWQLFFHLSRQGTIAFNNKNKTEKAFKLNVGKNWVF